MWYDRLKGETACLPADKVDIGRYRIDSSNLTLTSGIKPEKGVLVSDGTDSFRLGSEAYMFALPDGSLKDEIEQFSKVFETLDQEMTQSQELISPFMPAAVIDDQSHLLPFEKTLLDVLEKGHLHHISLRPRLDLYYEDAVTDIARAKRLSKGALVHLASHSECWQRQTLSGVIPKKVLARLSEDDYNTYENRVYGRLVGDIEQYLQVRIRSLRKLQTTLLDAQEFYQATDLNHRLRADICSLWGQAFDEAQTSKASSILEDTLNTLESMWKAIIGLKQKGLYQRVKQNVYIGNSLHMTNILGHDGHYRHLAVLWHLLQKLGEKADNTPEKRYQRSLDLAHAYSRYAGFVLRQALQPYMSGSNNGQWAGRTLSLNQEGLEWILTSSTSGVDKSRSEELLKVVPWFGFTKSHLENPKHDVCPRIIAWPALEKVNDHSELDGNWVALSPFDFYCVERFGYLVDRLLYRHVIKDFGQPLSKVPSSVLTFSDRNLTNALHINSAKNLLVVREALSNKLFTDLRQSLIDSNAVQQAVELDLRQQEIIALQVCPVCYSKVILHFQPPLGFRASCDNCRTERYFSVQENKFVFEQKLEGKVDFRTTGRRAFHVAGLLD